MKERIRGILENYHNCVSKTNVRRYINQCFREAEKELSDLIPVLDAGKLQRKR